MAGLTAMDGGKTIAIIETRLKRGLAPGRFIGSKRGHTNTSGDLSLTRVMPMYM